MSQIQRIYFVYTPIFLNVTSFSNRFGPSTFISIRCFFLLHNRL